VFSNEVTMHWLRGIPAETPRSDKTHVVIDTSLGEDREVSLLRVRNGPTILRLTPELARALSLTELDTIPSTAVAGRIADAGIVLNDPDHLFYLAPAARDELRVQPPRIGTRRLTLDDRRAFDRFVDDAPAPDLDEAFVELDHWLVFGTFDNGRLVAAASMYPWHGSHLADLGVITLPAARARGFARATIRAMSAYAIELGYEPQYRCQLDNLPSVALARAAGFTLFGDWEVAIDEPSS